MNDQDTLTCKYWEFLEAGYGLQVNATATRDAPRLLFSSNLAEISLTPRWSYRVSVTASSRPQPWKTQSLSRYLLPLTPAVPQYSLRRPCEMHPKQSTYIPYDFTGINKSRLTQYRKHWRQLDQFHSLTDLKISVSSHKEPLITAGLRSVCWKVRISATVITVLPIDLLPRSFYCSRPSTVQHG